MAFTTWLEVEPGADVWDLVPGTGEALRALYASLFDAGVAPDLLERCRRRVDDVVNARPTGDDRALPEGERALLAFAEQYSLDPHGVTDAQAEALHRWFTPEQLAALTTALATFDGLARVVAVLAADGGTPASIDLTAT